jgi:hypothetical protein
VALLADALESKLNRASPMAARWTAAVANTGHSAIRAGGCRTHRLGLIYLTCSARRSAATISRLRRTSGEMADDEANPPADVMAHLRFLEGEVKFLERKIRQSTPNFLGVRAVPPLRPAAAR